MNRKKINNLLLNIAIYSFLFSSFLHNFAYASNDTVKSVLQEVATVLLVIGGLVCVGKLIQIGIMFMMVSVDQKSQAKTAALPWLIGTIVCFGAPWIGNLIINILDTRKENVLDY